MDQDDQPVGRVLTRREVLKLLGVAGAATLTSCAPPPAPEPTATAARAVGAAPSATSPGPTATMPPTATGAPVATTATATGGSVCIVRPELTEGPFFLSDEPQREDIRSDSATGTLSLGLPLTLEFAVGQVAAGTCQPLAGAVVDIWHCDADGVYSGVQGDSANFLRGYQVTGPEGVARFVTIYPGWYPGRAVHIHFKIRTPTDAGTYEFTSQLFFDEAVTAQVYAQAPYASRGSANTRNADDRIFADPLVLMPTPNDTGYAARFDIALDLSDGAVGAED